MIYVACPANVVTGGPTLSHQMCVELNNMGHPARMFYYGQNRQIEDWVDIEKSPYGRYKLECADSIEEVDASDNILIIPEMAVPLREQFLYAKICIWWMSVDGYLVSVMNGVDALQKDMVFFSQKNVFHFVQSKYAYDFVVKDMRIPDERVMYLTDYIDEIYLKPCDMTSNERKDIVYYNHTKCGQELPLIMDRYPDINWAPIKGMTMEQVRDAFIHGKVYVDFGMHPGKDRMPREAASCGLCIITNMKGSAGNDEDVPIKNEYKFVDPVGNMEQVVEKVRECLEQYDNKINDFSEYREWIIGEKLRFIKEVSDVADRLLYE